MAWVQEGDPTGLSLGRVHFDKQHGQNEMKLDPFNKAIVVYLNTSPLHKDTITSNKDLCTATRIICPYASSTVCDFWPYQMKNNHRHERKMGDIFGLGSGTMARTVKH